MQNKVFNYTELFDSHAHLSMLEDFGTEVAESTKVTEGLEGGESEKNSLLQIVDSAKNSGVMKIVDVANDIETSKKTLQAHTAFPETVLATVGIHPELAIPGCELYKADLTSEIINQQLSEIDKLLIENPNSYSMIGEIGLDYYWLEKSELPTETIEKSKTLQKSLLEGQLFLAQKYNLPITLHARNSYADCLAMVKKYPKVTGVFHSFTETLPQAKEIFEAGFAIGINGIITYKSALALRDTIVEITKGKTIETPADLYNCGIYLETDSPFLIPSNIQKRPKYNSPQSISVLWDFIYNLLNNP